MARAAPQIRSVVDQDGAVILDIEQDHFFCLDPVGAYIWSRLLNGDDLDHIAQALAQDTGADITRVILDVQQFVADLKRKHLLEFSE